MLSNSEKLAYSTIRIECKLKNGKNSTGTGFFFSFLENKEDNTSTPVIITNKHVVKDAIEGKFIFTTSDKNGHPIDTKHFGFVVKDLEKLSRFHPENDVDLCAIPIGHFINDVRKKGINLFFIPFSKDILLEDKHENELFALEEILMIGYPNGIWDSVNNMPIFRRGSTATNPMKDYNEKKEFLIDIAAFPGSSGSPVLIFNQGNYHDKRGNIYNGADRIILMGILYAGPQATAKGDIIFSPNSNKPYTLSRIPNNLGIVIKSERILKIENLFR